MTPNLRYNKSITKKLIRSCPKKEDRVGLLSINWGMDNKKDVYGLKVRAGLFGYKAYFLQRQDEQHFRLIVPIAGMICSFYIIDNIEDFLEFVGVQRLEMEEPEITKNAIETTTNVPNTGIILIKDGLLYVYDHSNY